MNTILAIGAHPDDIEFGCGGTLLTLREKFKIVMYVLTKGDFGGNVNVRKKEQEKSCKIIGSKLIWGNLKDTEVQFNRKLITDIENVISKEKPTFVFVNYYRDTHQDHVAIGKATITAARYINNLIFYETPTSIDFSPSLYANIEPVFDDKLKLIRAHFSQINKTRVKNLSIIESVKSTAIFRGYQGRVKYAEGFVPQRVMIDLLCLKK